MSDEQQNSEQSSESTSIESNEQPMDTNQVETQGSPTAEQVDTPDSIRDNGSEVGLQKTEASEEVDSDEEFSKGLDDLVSAALNGGLSDEQRASLDKAGLGSHFDMIVQGHQAVIAKNDAEIISVVGDKAAYGELQEWALSNLNDQEIASFNMAVIESGDIGLAKLAVEGLQARYQRVNGVAPSKRIEAGGTANEAARPYSNRDEYINETRSVKYRSDPEYEKLVEARRNLSGF